MPYQLKPGETARHAAQALLGHAGLFSQLRSAAWDGNPDHVKPGQTFYLDTEVQGPPSNWLADPKRWGRGSVRS